MRIEPGTKPIHAPVAIVREPNPPVKIVPPEAVAPPPSSAPAWRVYANAPKTKGRPLTRSPVAAADPFRGHFAIPADVDPTKCRVCLEMDGLPEDSAAVKINGVFAGGVIGRPLRLDITGHLKAGQNTLLIEP